MTHAIAHTLLRWLPADSRAGVARRAFIVWGVALLIAVLQWLMRPQEHPMDRSLVYSYAISTCIWFFTDPVRIVLSRWLHTQPPHYWGVSARSIAYLFAGIVGGYALGTQIGDAYAGQSTWELLTLSPQRFWGFWLSSLGISFGFLFYFYQREKGAELQRQATEARLKLLETQLEPHMLFNTLANLRALIATDPVRAVHMLDRLNDYLRATLRASRTDSNSGAHTLADEFARLRDYLELMAIRMGPRMAYALHLPDTLQHHPVPPLLLQPLVENAIRHGLEPALQGGEITVRVRREGDVLRITVQDTGIGFDGVPEAGFGLNQVRERLATAFPGQGHMQLHAVPGQGTRVTLQLPVQQPASPPSPAQENSP